MPENLHHLFPPQPPPDSHQRDIADMDRQLQALRDEAVARIRLRDIDSLASMLLPYFRDPGASDQRPDIRSPVNIFSARMLPPAHERFDYARIFCAALIKAERFQSERHDKNAAMLLAVIATCLITPANGARCSTSYAEIGAILVGVSGARPRKSMDDTQIRALRRFLLDLTATNGAQSYPEVKAALMGLYNLTDKDIEQATKLGLQAIATTVTQFVDDFAPDADAPLVALRSNSAITA